MSHDDPGEISSIYLHILVWAVGTKVWCINSHLYSAALITHMPGSDGCLYNGDGQSTILY